MNTETASHLNIQPTYTTQAAVQPKGPESSWSDKPTASRGERRTGGSMLKVRIVDTAQGCGRFHAGEAPEWGIPARVRLTGLVRTAADWLDA
jgi:hypothetical protein